MFSKGTLAVNSSIAALFTFFGHRLRIFLTRDFVEYGKKTVPLILCACIETALTDNASSKVWVALWGAYRCKRLVHWTDGHCDCGHLFLYVLYFDRIDCTVE
jgi:hypothetical protein